MPKKRDVWPKKLISLLLEDLSNILLHASLYGERHKALDDCIKDAINFDDSCGLYGNVEKKVNSSDTSSTQSMKTKETSSVRAHAIAVLVIKKMN